eukprot:PITA_01965
MIANRIKPLLPSLILEEQTGYVEGRQVLNNIIQAHEVVHSLKRNKQVGMIIQLDLAKAYDKLSWSYIRAILRAYGFYQNWIRWVMALVTTTSFSILLNGAPTRTLTPSRGLRLGDPLSSFLFVLMMEGLGRAIKMANVEGRIQGTEVSLNKSKVFFFNTNIAIQRNITRILGLHREQLPSKYLGITLTGKPLRKKVWELILNKLQDKVRKWTCRSLNMVGHLVLKQAVLQTIPIFMFLALPAPQGIKQHIRSIQRDILWGRGEEKKKWDLVAQGKLCKPKSHGGLGLHDPKNLSRVSGANL